MEFKDAVEKLLSRKDRVSVSEYNHNKSNQLINTLLDFISEDSTRGLCLYDE